MPHHCRPPAPCPRHKSRHPRTHRPCVGGGVLPRPITAAPTAGHAGPALQKHYCRAGPMCPAVPLYPLQKARHCEASAHTGCGNPYSLPPGDRKGRPYAPSFRFQLFSFLSVPRKNPPEAAASGGDSYAQFQFFLKTPRRRSAPPGTAPAPRAHTHTGPRCTTGRPGSCGCRY